MYLDQRFNDVEDIALVAFVQELSRPHSSVDSAHNAIGLMNLALLPLEFVGVVPALGKVIVVESGAEGTLDGPLGWEFALLAVVASEDSGPRLNLHKAVVGVLVVVVGV